ncbi:hypothetical protein P7C70_g1800, partial [Phenoliferia sp. Uapishka_3]
MTTHIRQRNLSKALWTHQQHVDLLQAAAEILPATGVTPSYRNDVGSALWRTIEVKAGGGRGVKACWEAYNEKPSYLLPPENEEVDELEDDEVAQAGSPTPASEDPAVVPGGDDIGTPFAPLEKGKGREMTSITREPSDDDVIIILGNSCRAFRVYIVAQKVFTLDKSTPGGISHTGKPIKRELTDDSVEVLGNVLNVKRRKFASSSAGVPENVPAPLSPLHGRSKPSLLESMIQIAELTSGGDEKTKAAGEVFASLVAAKWRS